MSSISISLSKCTQVPVRQLYIGVSPLQQTLRLRALLRTRILLTSLL